MHPLKSRDSAGEVDISDEFASFLTDFRKANRRENFVIPTPPKAHSRKPKNPADGTIGEATSVASSESYRCTKVFEELTAWLRAHGVSSKRPIHELRKEVGSLIAAEHGVYAASRFLRHADIRITAATYLDKKKRIVAPV